MVATCIADDVSVFVMMSVISANCIGIEAAAIHQSTTTAVVINVIAITIVIAANTFHMVVSIASSKVISTFIFCIATTTTAIAIVIAIVIAVVIPLIASPAPPSIRFIYLILMISVLIVLLGTFAFRDVYFDQSGDTCNP